MTLEELEKYKIGSEYQRMITLLTADLLKIEDKFNKYKNKESNQKLVIILEESSDKESLLGIHIGSNLLFEKTIGIEELYKAEIKMIKDFIELLEVKFEKL